MQDEEFLCRVPEWQRSFCVRVVAVDRMPSVRNGKAELQRRRNDRV